MELSVLKNRLLQRTKRRFREADYGAGSIGELVGKHPDLLVLGGGRPPTVTLLEPELNVEQRSTGDEPVPETASDAGREDEATDFQALLDRYRTNGDNLGVGEAYASQLETVEEADLDKTFVNVVSRWASSSPVDVEMNSVGDLLENVDKFVNEQLALAVVHTTMRMEDASRIAPAGVGDLHYRVAESLRSLFQMPAKTSRPQTMRVATVKTREVQSALETAVDGFCKSTAVAAKLPSTEVIKCAHAYARYALVGERQTLRDVEVLLGTTFRKFCESCERYKAQQIPRRARDLRSQLQRTLDSLGSDLDHRLRQRVLEPVARHMSHLIDEGTQASDEMMTPALGFAGATFKLDLARGVGSVVFPVRVVNEGDGTAYGVEVRAGESVSAVTLSVSEPQEPFELAPGTERLIRLQLGNTPRDGRVLELDAVLSCETVNGTELKFEQSLAFEQQGMQPEWDELLRSPPYGINPIRDRKDLYGRDSVLGDLELQASNETSTFLWGQKRVGKTSVLQVLAGNLAERSDIVCIVLRMGEVASMHEGQLGHRVATRLVEALGTAREVPSEEEFRGGLGRLVPFVETLTQDDGRKMLVIIDEFDDLNPAFYLGERGKQFVKALRSLSEVGLTFMFVGSERMHSIYQNHSADLNKWMNRSLDRIEVKEDCEALITEPVAGKIEYEADAVKRIVDYCRGNPFYMHLVAGKVFQRCAQERRTFVGSSDLEHVRHSIVSELGPTNFAHFWQDVPVLDPDDKERRVAQNCLFLACVATLGSGGYESLGDLAEAQVQLGLEPQERLPSQELRDVETGLLRRRVLSRQRGGGGTELELPVFRDWLLDNGERELLPLWRSYQDEQASKGTEEEPGRFAAAESSAFPVDEDDLLAVSERLVYLGRQKDVAEVRRWLRQFDDESRIEMAFLLLQRLAEKGFVNAGANVNGLAKMEESLNARRQDVGGGAWRVLRRRLDNLYLGHVDSETKSGAATARELAKRMNPGRCASTEGMRTWAHAHLDHDPMLVVVDDFAGTGNTLAKGLERLWSTDPDLFSGLAEEGRVVCCLQTAFPEAIRRVKRKFPRVGLLPMTTFDDEVRALAPEAAIFEEEAERKYAEEMILQIGRQLVPQNPLGFGNMAALVSFHNTIPNNTLPIFWSAGKVNGREWQPLLPRGSFRS